MAPSILKTGARQGSGTTFGKVNCHSKLNIVKHPSHFKVVRDPHATVARVFATRPLNLYFRRALVDNKLVEWQNLISQIVHVQLVDGSDTFR